MQFSLQIIDPSDPTKNLTLKHSYRPETVWITREDGEGGEFDLKKLYGCLDKFYNDNF